MPSRRLLKAAEAIREVVGMAILTDISDPRVADVTVLGVEVAADMRQAKVFVTIMGNETKQKLCLHGLQSAAGYLQSKVAKRIDTRYTPKLLFVNDLGVKKSIEISQILGRVLNDEAKSGAAKSDAALADGTTAEDSLVGAATLLPADQQNTGVPHELIDDASELLDEDADFASNNAGKMADTDSKSTAAGSTNSAENSASDDDNRPNRSPAAKEASPGDDV